MIVFATFNDQQQKHNFTAISYAVMDGHNYLDRSCNFNVDSIEVFFDISDSALVAYVEALLAFEMAQEIALGRAFAGYISLRFMAPTSALIGMQRQTAKGTTVKRVCAIEVAGLRDVRGVTELIDFALTLANDNNIGGVLHWGQRHTATRSVVEQRFGDSAGAPGGNLARWRRALSRITDHGRLDGFSNAFSRRTGLEIVSPIIWIFTVMSSIRGQPIEVEWDCRRNPSATQISLSISAPSGMHHGQNALPLAGKFSLIANESGQWTVAILAETGSGPLKRTASENRFAYIT
jgi:hypothetical protein